MQHDIDNSVEAMNFVVVHRIKVLKDATVLPAVWQMLRKRDMKIGTVKKYKAGLNIDGSIKQKGFQDANFAVNLSLQTIQEYGHSAYCVFVDLVKAYNTVNRELL